jgi:putative membrane protein
MAFVLENTKRNRTILKVVSVAIPLVVAILLNPKVGKIQLGDWTKVLPHLNGIINSLTSITLLMGFYFIKQKNVAAHRRMMGLSFVFGSFFLLGYVLYHLSNESTPFGGQGVVRVIYYFLLISHIVLSIGVVWFVLRAIFYALSGQIEAHKKVAKWAFPIWLYVSITGVIVYMMIRPYYAP